MTLAISGNGTLSKDGEGVRDTQGIARAWVNINGAVATAVARDSFNLSSLTDHGIGDYSLNFSVAQSNTNYAVGGSAQVDTAGAATGFVILAIHRTPTALSAGSCRAAWNNSANAVADPSVACAAVFGD